MKSMGGVAVLHPQDSLSNHHPDNLKSHRTIRLTPSYTNTPNFTASDRRRHTQPPRGTLKKNKPVGVQQSETVASVNQSYQIRSDPEILSTQMKNNPREFFAGSAFVDSPPPSSVPIPGFFTKNLTAAVKDDPTTELRRILGLSLS